MKYEILKWKSGRAVQNRKLNLGPLDPSMIGKMGREAAKVLKKYQILRFYVK